MHTPGKLKGRAKSYKLKKQRLKKNYNWKVTPRDNVILKVSNGALISRWLTDGSDHNKRYNCSMWPDNDLSIVFSLQQFLR